MILTIVTKFAHTKTSGKRPCKVCDEEIQIGTQTSVPKNSAILSLGTFSEHL